METTHTSQDHGDAFFGIMPAKGDNPFFRLSNREIEENIAMIEANMPWRSGTDQEYAERDLQDLRTVLGVRAAKAWARTTGRNAARVR